MSFLHIPSDDRTPRRIVIVDLSKACGPDAAAGHSGDAILLDLQDADGDHAAPARGAALRVITALRDIAKSPVILGLHGLDAEDEMKRDIQTAIESGVEVVALPGARSGADLQRLDVMLSVAEAENGVPVGRIRILAVIGDNATGLLAAASFAGKSDRLAALGWHGRRLRTQAGRAMDRTARDMTLLAATAAGVLAVDWADDTGGAAKGSEGFCWIMVEAR